MSWAISLLNNLRNINKKMLCEYTSYLSAEIPVWIDQNSIIP